MKFLFLFFLVFNFLLLSDTNTSNYSLRLGYGEASSNDLGEIISGDLGAHPKDLNVLSVDAGYLLKKDLWSVPLDFYVKSGVAYFDEYSFKDTLELTLYVKLYWNINFWKNRVRLGFGEGVSYTFNTLESEYYEAQMDEEPTSKFLNYLDISLDFDVGRLVRYKPLFDTYIGYAIKHRSGIFGLFNDVHGGSNYNTFYLEKNF